MLNFMPGELVVLSATNIIEERKTFHPKPDDTDGKVPNTPFIQDLYLKIENLTLFLGRHEYKTRLHAK